MRTALKDQYFAYLYSIVGGKNRTYSILSKYLHTVQFRWSVPNDDNRCSDGIELRHRYVSEAHLNPNNIEVRGWLKGDCSVFELLVALAERIDNEIMYELGNGQPHIYRWYEEMILNLRLAEFKDKIVDHESRFTEMEEQRIYKIVEIFMDRTYGSDGIGSLFPSSKKTGPDLRTVEIWYQMMNYFEENYSH